MAFYLRRLTFIKYNYGIGERKLLIIINAFRDWRIILYSVQALIRVFLDYANLIGFAKKQRLTPCQARWALILSKYNFIIEY